MRAAKSAGDEPALFTLASMPHLSPMTGTRHGRGREKPRYTGVTKKGDEGGRERERDGWILAVGESVDPDQKSDGARANDTYETIAHGSRPVRISDG